MAEMDSRVLYGPCLVVLLTPRAKSGVTGSALGQLGQELERWRIQSWSQARQAGRG